MWQERLPGAMLPRATSIRPGHGDQPRWPTRACQQWREQCLRTGLRPGSTSRSSLPPLCGVTVERASRHRADTRNPPKGQTFTPFDDGPGRRSSIAGPHEPPARPFRGSSSWVVYRGPRHTTRHARGTPLNRARALRRTAEIAPSCPPLRPPVRLPAAARCQPITEPQRRSGGLIGRPRDTNRAIRPGCALPLEDRIAFPFRLGYSAR